jgi:hypothetical protein
MLGGDGFPHPGLVAMSAFARNVDGLEFIRYQKLANGIYAALFSNGTKTVAIVTGQETKKAAIGCNISHSVADLYGNPGASSYEGRIIYITARYPAEQLANSLSVRPF